MKQQKIELKQERMELKMEKELQKGVWCGYKEYCSCSNSKIKYDQLLHSSTNMVNPGVGLDTQSGINFFKSLFLYVLSHLVIIV